MNTMFELYGLKKKLYGDQLTRRSVHHKSTVAYASMPRPGSRIQTLVRNSCADGFGNGEPVAGRSSFDTCRKH
jgi:hypothetical protein